MSFTVFACFLMSPKNNAVPGNFPNEREEQNKKSTKVLGTPQQS